MTSTNEDIRSLRRTVAAIGVVGEIDGHDVIRRSSVLDIIDRRVTPQPAPVDAAEQSGRPLTHDRGALDGSACRLAGLIGVAYDASEQCKPGAPFYAFTRAEMCDYASAIRETAQQQNAVNSAVERDAAKYRFVLESLVFENDQDPDSGDWYSHAYFNQDSITAPGSPYYDSADEVIEAALAAQQQESEGAMRAAKSRETASPEANAATEALISELQQQETRG